MRSALGPLQKIDGPFKRRLTTRRMALNSAAAEWDVASAEVVVAHERAALLEVANFDGDLLCVATDAECATGGNDSVDFALLEASPH